MSILVSHPHGAAVANATAEAFERHGLLAGYYGGVIAAADSLQGRVLEAIARSRPVARNRIAHGVPARGVHALPGVELAARGIGRLLASTGLVPVVGGEAVFAGHDMAMALAPWPTETSVVYAYEDAARYTFARAARHDFPRVWDLPAAHYLTIEDIWTAEGRRWPGAMGAMPRLEPRWKRRYKDAELALATHVSTASTFTKASLERLDVRAPISVLPYGFPVEAFAPKHARRDGPFTAIAVGSADLRKGTPYLLEAWKRAGLRDARLRLVGPMRLTTTFLADYAGLFEHVGTVPRALLGDIYRDADVLLFPTLGDGFGLVIQEAMCCATPVVTTRCGGGPESISDGADGWIVPARDVDALVDALRRAAADRDATFAVGQRARERAERYTWREAGDRIAQAFGPLV